MLAIVLALVFLFSSTLNFADILTHSKASYSALNSRRNNLPKIIEQK